MAAILDINLLSDTLNCLFPSNTFLPRTYYFFHISQLATICLKNRYFEKQIHWVPLNMERFRVNEASDGSNSSYSPNFAQHLKDVHELPWLRLYSILSFCFHFLFIVLECYKSVFQC